MDSKKKCKDDVFWLLIILFFFLLIPIGLVLLSVKSQICDTYICNPIIIAISLLMILLGLIGLVFIHKKIIKNCNQYILKI